LKWSDLEHPWQECLVESWDALLAGTVSIGAVVVDRQGKIVGRGRNHIYDDTSQPHQISRHPLAHAEINALLSMPPLSSDEIQACALYTAVEPCPLCMGAIYMAGVRTFHYACRDAWAGSANLLGTTPYLSVKSVRAFSCSGTLLEDAVCALHVLHVLRRDAQRNRMIVDLWAQDSPAGARLGEELLRCGYLEQVQADRPPTAQAFDELFQRLENA